MTPKQIKKIIAEKVEGHIKPAHDEYGHHYRFVDSGKVVDSVTTILGRNLSKPHLMRWAVRQGIFWLEENDRWSRLKDPLYREEYLTGAQSASTDIRDSAGLTGGTAHAIIEAYTREWIKSGIRPTDIRSLAADRTDARSIAAARAFEQLVTKHDIVPLVVEALVGDERYSAGTLDLLCLFEGELCLLDHKTSNQIDKISYPIQVSAYKHFFELMSGLKIKKVKVLHLSKDTDKYAIYNVVRPYRAYQAFKSMCAFDRWVNDDSEKIVKDVKRMVI